MFLNYLALVVILVVLVMMYYVFIYIHELPYETAKHRGHPQQDAIYVACWLSLFTLHAIWPLVFIWALTYKKPSDTATESATPSTDAGRLSQLEYRLERLEKQLSKQAQGSVGA